MRMALGDKHCFAVGQLMASGLAASPQLAEDAVHCLELVAELSQIGLSFQFKGGNSLLLILPAPQRFSIDVDIATDEPKNRIEEGLNQICAEFGVFTSWEPRRHKTKPWLPMSSYYLNYRSALEAETFRSIMLDVQLRRSPYETRMEAVRCGTLYSSDAMVELPLGASIMGDKLLTMGPETLGIPLGKGKEAQRLKHVFDVSTLLADGADLEKVRRSFDGCLVQENEIQNTLISAEAVLSDTLRFCASTLPHASIPEDVVIDSAVLEENVRGLAPFEKHLFRETYSWEMLRYDMARVALLITGVVRKKITSEMLRATLAENASTENNASLEDLWAVVAEWSGYRFGA